MNTRLIVAAALMFLPVHASAQILYGSLVGNVKDTSDAAIPGAEVRAVHAETNQTRTTLTNDSGGFTFANLAPGTYEVSVSREGFRPARNTGVAVTINSVSRADVTLEVGAITESINVSAATAALQTDRAEVRAELTSKALTNLPVPPGRNYQGLFVLIPGFTPPENRHSVPGNPSRALVFSVNGTSAQSNNTRIDGASSSNIWRPDAVAYVPALESIETVNVVTNSFDAEQGLAGGAAINVQIKSGTNSLHGSAFEYYNGNRLKARPFFLPASERKPKDVFNQFGGTVGGPIVRDKLFYFLSYEGTYNHRFASAIGSVPTAAMRGGDLSGAPAARPIYDPFTGSVDGSGRTPIPGNQIPVSRMPAAVQKILPLWPNPTLPGTQNNYFAAGRFTLDRNTIDTKVNWNATPKLNMYGRYSYLMFESANRQFFGDQLGGAPIAGGQAGFAQGHSTSFTVAGSYVVRPNFLIDAYFGYTRAEADSRQPRLDENIGKDFLNLPGTNGTRWFEGGWPQFNIANFTLFGAPNGFQPNILNDPQYQYVVNANWTRGGHNVRFGI
ncbi:MAG TPA: carboxypeptidase-like regulatory domain-containing protein, partial [Terriglobia bacterium]|nr:carboxypeptidase-like regulatory domain-containing protein [Terriglobia bacterium]